jgi:signal transduction histidine kinase
MNARLYVPLVVPPRLSATQWEWLLAVGLTIGIELEYRDRFNALEAVVALLITVPLAFRLRFPLAALVVVLSGIVVEGALGGVAGSDIPVFPIVSLAVALLAVGARANWAGVGFGAGMTFVAWSIATRLTTPHGSIAVGGLLTCGGLLVGRAMGVLRFESDVLVERASALERERDERAQQAVAEERLRIARELHDVIGHSISVMGVQAGAVRSVLRPDQEREREALLSVERTGREAVAEMRRLIGLMRTEPSESGAPTPTLRGADDLVEAIRRAGLAVELHVCGDLSSVPPGVDLAGYRVLQEALTNALKHAPDSTVDATVICNPQHLEIAVVDDGVGTSLTPSEDGHGLLGMQERVSLYGGELHAGPRPEGGYEVRARIPLVPT